MIGDEIRLANNDTVREAGRQVPPFPSIFFKPSTSVIGHDENVIVPKIAQDDQADYEGELVSLKRSWRGLQNLSAAIFVLYRALQPIADMISVCHYWEGRQGRLRGGGPGVRGRLHRRQRHLFPEAAARADPGRIGATVELLQGLRYLCPVGSCPGVYQADC